LENLIHKIKLGEWNYYSKTNEISGLKKYGINSKNISEMQRIVDTHISGESDDLDDDVHKLKSKYTIQELTIFYSNLELLFSHKSKVEKILFGLQLKSNPTQALDEAIKQKCERLKRRFNIDVKNIKDLSKVDKAIILAVDRFNRNYKVDEEDVEKGITFQQLMISVFRLLGHDKIDYELVLSDFFEMKTQALNHKTKKK